MGQTKTSKYRWNKCFLKIVSVILSSFYHTDVFSSAHFSHQFGFNLLFDDLKIGFHAMIDGLSSAGCVRRNPEAQHQHWSLLLKTVAPNYVTSAKWQRLYPWYFGISFAQRMEVEKRRSDSFMSFAYTCLYLVCNLRLQSCMRLVYLSPASYEC